MPMPLGPILWVLQKLERFVRWVWKKQKQGPLKKAVVAWSAVGFPLLSDSLVRYYEFKGVPLFTYPGLSTRVPLYVRQSWLSLTDQSLVMTLSPTDSPVQLGKKERAFVALYPKVRRAMGLAQLWNGRVFRLVKLGTSDDQLRLEFELGHFFDALACQYALEHEARLVLSRRRKGKEVEACELPLRESLAATSSAIERFCETQAVRIGISNLILFRVDRNTYRPAIRARGSLSMGHMGNFDPISSGILDISTANPNVDFQIYYKVLKEIYEELFGGKEVEKEMSGLEPDFFFSKRPIKALRDMLDDGRASFRLTGFCIDLIRVVPEITTVLVVRDESYYAEYRDKFKVNLEYGPPSFCEIPQDILDVDEYLAKRFPSNPAEPEGKKGFDPSNWTLPGAFCFYQGLKRAVSGKLL